MSYILYLAFGVLPSLLWLAFYLREDAHPEPKREILLVFLFGMLATVPAIFFEIFLSDTIKSFGLGDFLTTLLVNVIAVAFIEEFVKYAAVWAREQRANHNALLDEPVDFVIYMIVSALGFAAVENLLFLLPIIQLNLAIMTTIVRAVSAILLHTLCSGMIGYYMARSYCDREHKRRLVAKGFLIASALHGVYNLFIIKSGEDLVFLMIPLTILAGMALFLFKGFGQLKKLNSVCQLKVN